VVEVDLAQQQLVLEPSAGESLELRIDSNSDLSANGNAIDLAAIQPGDRVAVVYRATDTAKTAQKVTVLD
jgi:hypothetical protein